MTTLFEDISEQCLLNCGGEGCLGCDVTPATYVVLRSVNCQSVVDCAKADVAAVSVNLVLIEAAQYLSICSIGFAALSVVVIVFGQTIFQANLFEAAISLTVIAMLLTAGVADLSDKLLGSSCLDSAASVAVAKSFSAYGSSITLSAISSTIELLEPFSVVDADDYSVVASWWHAILPLGTEYGAMYKEKKRPLVVFALSVLSLGLVTTEYLEIRDMLSPFAAFDAQNKIQNVFDVGEYTPCVLKVDSSETVRIYVTNGTTIDLTSILGVATPSPTISTSCGGNGIVARRVVPNSYDDFYEYLTYCNGNGITWRLYYSVNFYPLSGVNVSIDDWDSEDTCAVVSCDVIYCLRDEIEGTAINKRVLLYDSTGDVTTNLTVTCPGIEANDPYGECYSSLLLDGPQPQVALFAYRVLYSNPDSNGNPRNLEVKWWREIYSMDGVLTFSNFSDTSAVYTAEGYVPEPSWTYDTSNDWKLAGHILYRNRMTRVEVKDIMSPVIEDYAVGDWNIRFGVEGVYGIVGDIQVGGCDFIISSITAEYPSYVRTFFLLNRTTGMVSYINSTRDLYTELFMCGNNICSNDGLKLYYWTNDAVARGRLALPTAMLVTCVLTLVTM